MDRLCVDLAPPVADEWIGSNLEEGPVTDEPLIRIVNATVFRGETRVFKGLSIDIGQGEQVAIVGPNGAGKTTLLKLLNRELYPVQSPESRVEILGRDRWNVWDLRRHIGLVSDDLRVRYPLDAPALDVVLSGFFSSIGTHGLLAQQVTEEHRKRALEALAGFGAESFANTPLKKLSTGQQRRCLLARAIVHDPETLILDEPMAGLDLAARFDYLERIRRLIADGRSIILVTHHLGEIPPEVGRVVLLSHGTVVADGPKADVLSECNLRRTFGVPVVLIEDGGYYFARPASASKL